MLPVTEWNYNPFESITPHIDHDWYKFPNLGHILLIKVFCVLCTISVLFPLATAPGSVSKPAFRICPLGYFPFYFLSSPSSLINPGTQWVYNPTSRLTFHLLFYYFSALRVNEYVTILSHLSLTKAPALTSKRTFS